MPKDGYATSAPAGTLTPSLGLRPPAGPGAQRPVLRPALSWAPAGVVIEEIGPMPVAPHGGEQPVVVGLLATQING